MNEKIDYEHKVYDSEHTASLAQAAALEIDHLSTKFRTAVEDVLDQVPNAPQSAFEDFKDILDDATGDLFGTIVEQYNLEL